VDRERVYMAGGLVLVGHGLLLWKRRMRGGKT